MATLKLRFLWILFAQFLHECGKNARIRAGVRRLPATRRRSAAAVCDLLRAGRYLHKCDPQLWLWTEWPAALPGSRFGRDAGVSPRSTGSDGHVLPVARVADRPSTASGAQQQARERKLSIGLYHDLALATDRFGSDLWAHRPFFVDGCRVGSPPDDFAPKGQDWGFPPPERATASGRRLSAVRRIHPQKLPPRRSAAHRPRDAAVPPLLDSGRLRARPKAPMCARRRAISFGAGSGKRAQPGDDCGRGPGHRGARDPRNPGPFRHFELSTVLFRKERAWRVPRCERVPARRRWFPLRRTICLRWRASGPAPISKRGGRPAWWTKRVRGTSGRLRDTEKQKMLDGCSRRGCCGPICRDRRRDYPELTGELHHAAIGFLAGTPSQLLAINQEDMTKEASQQNLPGTTWQYPNWGRKMRFTVEELRDNEEARSFAAMVRDWIINSGRENR